MAEFADDFRDPAAHEARPSLVRLAYRLLGSVEEAEDVVQDALVKLLAGGRRPDDTRAYLFRTVTNLAIDRLRHLKVQRRVYQGPWLPEPIVTEPAGAEGVAASADDLSVAFLLLLERLSVSERVVYVLREALDLSFNEMAEVLDVQPAACRQRYRRARRKLADVAPPSPGPMPQHRPTLERRALEDLLEVVNAGDVKRLAAMLTDDALALTDGGGRVSAAIRPIEGPQRIAQVTVHLAHRDHVLGMELHFVGLNGGTGLLITAVDDDGRPYPYAVIQVHVEGDRLSRIYAVRNPKKLARVFQGTRSPPV